MQEFLQKWCEFKNIYEKDKAEIMTIPDKEQREKIQQALRKCKMNGNCVLWELLWDVIELYEKILLI